MSSWGYSSSTKKASGSLWNHWITCDLWECIWIGTPMCGQWNIGILMMRVSKYYERQEHAVASRNNVSSGKLSGRCQFFWRSERALWPFHKPAIHPPSILAYFVWCERFFFVLVCVRISCCVAFAPSVCCVSRVSAPRLPRTVQPSTLETTAEKETEPNLTAFGT